MCTERNLLLLNKFNLQFSGTIIEFTFIHRELTDDASDLQLIANAEDNRTNLSSLHLGRIFLEKEIFPSLAGKGKLFAFKTERFWMSIKSAG